MPIVSNIDCPLSSDPQPTNPVGNVGTQPPDAKFCSGVSIAECPLFFDSSAQGGNKSSATRAAVNRGLN